MHNDYEDNDHVKFLVALSDLNQPYSCTQWGNVPDGGATQIISDTGYDIWGLFETDSSFPSTVWLDHEMRVYDQMNIAGSWSIGSQIDQMLEACGPPCEEGGCTDPNACNYNSTAIADNGSCVFEEDCYGECGGAAFLNECGVCVGGDTGLAEDIAIDCLGVCWGSAEVDECGVCNGDGIPSGECDCEGNIFDLCGECSGDNSSCSDCCGIPNGNGTSCAGECGPCNEGISDGYCDCFGNIEDCSGECGGPAVIDCMGVCEGTTELDCNGDCDGSAEIDECGLCGGDNASCTDCNGVINGSAVIDCSNVCGGSAFLNECGVCIGGDTGLDENTGIDCMGVCWGPAVEDECGICNGDSAIFGDTGCCEADVDDCGVCNGDNSTCADCYGTPNGDAYLDECGECGGDNGSCAYVILSSSISGNNLNVNYESNYSIGGFQFTVQGAIVNSAGGGAAEAAGFEISNSGYMVLAFSLSGSTIPAGSGILVSLDVSTSDEEIVLSNITISTPLAEGMASCYDAGTGCELQDYESVCGCLDPSGCNFDPNATMSCAGYSCEYAEENYDCEGNCIAEIDCDGVCGGSAMEDCAGECGGSAMEDCAGECGGSAMEDCAGVCGGASVISGCDNACNSTAVVDCAGVCGGASVISGCDNVCNSTAVVDCAGECGGNAIEDCAGVCGGGALYDCAGVCNGSSIIMTLCEDTDGDGLGNPGSETEECVDIGLNITDGCALPDLNLYLADDGSVYYNSSEAIAGFQFNIDDATINGASGGDAEAAGFMISSNATTVIAFSMTGTTIPVGCGTLIELMVIGNATGLSSIVVSNPEGQSLPFINFMTIDPNLVSDCEDEYPNCAENYYDCEDECGGSVVEDECGVCGGDSSDCADCAGVPYGSNLEDNCGTCDDDSSNDCVQDCADDWGGSAVLDECGVCNGPGAIYTCGCSDEFPEGACDCAGNLLDACGECGGPGTNVECWDGSWKCDPEDCPALPTHYPDWEDCPSCYENTASMTAIVLDALEGTQMYAEGDILAAFDDSGNVRGIALLLYPIPFGPYEDTGLWEIQIRGDEAGDAISFKYYDASEDEVLNSGTGYTFVIDDIIGDVISPHELSMGEVTVALSIDIASGWNWFSLNVEGDMSIGNVMGSLTSTDGDFIKSQNSSSTFYSDFGWYGGLEEFGVTGMYKFSSANADNLVISGSPVDPLSTPIELAAGWNWLGFTPQNDGPIGDALASATTSDGDFIKNQGASSTYYSDFGWYGGLEVMAPTEGYMFSVSEASVLTYPNFGSDDALIRSKELKVLPSIISDWVINPHAYEFNGTITLSIDNHADQPDDYIAVYVGDECRGITEYRDFPFDNVERGIYIMMVYSNIEKGEDLSFKYYDSLNDEIISYTENIEFTSDMIIGNGFTPFALSREVTPLPTEFSLDRAYPNPFNPVTTLSFAIPVDSEVSLSVYNLQGREVSTLISGYRDAGYHSVVWDANSHSSGVYFVKMVAGEYVNTQKLMLVK